MNVTDRAKKAQERLTKAGQSVDDAYAELVDAVHDFVAARKAQAEELRSQFELDEPRGLSAAEAPTSAEGVNNGE